MINSSTTAPVSFDVDRLYPREHTGSNDSVQTVATRSVCLANPPPVPSGKLEKPSDKPRYWRWRLVKQALANAIEALIIKLQLLIPHKACSKLFGNIANCQIKVIKNFLIRNFIWLYDVNLKEAIKKHPEEYNSFNEFFTRTLDKNTRKIPGPGKIASPVDGTISQIGNIKHDHIIQAKQHTYRVTDLLGGDKALAGQFKEGSFVNIYLSPGDYHRFHMPIDGRLVKTIYVPGKLYSVSPKTTKHIKGLFTKNERLIAIFNTSCGPMAMVMVGAINVSSIETTWEGGLIKAPAKREKIEKFFNEEKFYKKGNDLGAFHIGSTVICLFGKDGAGMSESLSSGSKVKMGQPIGACIPGKADDKTTDTLPFTPEANAHKFKLNNQRLYR